MEKLKKTIETKTALQANKETRLAEMRAQWLGPLNELLERINANFSTYLSMMDCAGEITLEEGENPVSLRQNNYFIYLFIYLP